MNVSHTKVSDLVYDMACIENGCDHGNSTYLENCPSEEVEICKECSDRTWDEYEGAAILWSKHQQHLDERLLEALDFDEERAS